VVSGTRQTVLTTLHLRNHPTTHLPIPEGHFELQHACVNIIRLKPYNNPGLLTDVGRWPSRLHLNNTHNWVCFGVEKTLHKHQRAWGMTADGSEGCFVSQKTRLIIVQQDKSTLEKNGTSTLKNTHRLIYKATGRLSKITRLLFAQHTQFGASCQRNVRIQWRWTSAFPALDPPCCSSSPKGCSVPCPGILRRTLATTRTIRTERVRGATNGSPIRSQQVFGRQQQQ